MQQRDAAIYRVAIVGQLTAKSYLMSTGRLNHLLAEVADSLHMSTRTLIRRLTAEHSSFQTIKDGLRRDLAILDLTVSTPGAYRNDIYAH